MPHHPRHTKDPSTPSDNHETKKEQLRKLLATLCPNENSLMSQMLANAARKAGITQAPKKDDLPKIH